MGKSFILLSSIKNCAMTECNQILVKLVQREACGINSVNIVRTAIGFIIRGEKRVFINDSTTTLSAGEMFVFGEGIHYEENILQDGAFEQIVFYISTEDLEKIIISVSQNYNISCQSNHICNKCRNTNFIATEPSPIIAEFFGYINRYFRHNSIRVTEAVEQIKLTELIFLILSDEDNCIKRFISLRADKASGKFAQQIYDNLFNDISIEQLAKQTNRSLTSFKKEFRRQFAQPPHKWFIEKRLQRAKILLITTNMTISEIGSHCAFSNISHFIKLFKQHFNNTPAALRKELKQHQKV